MAAAAVAVGSVHGPQRRQRLPLAPLVSSSPFSSSSSSSSRPRGTEQQEEAEGQALGLLDDDEEAEEVEGLYRRQVALLVRTDSVCECIIHTSIYAHRPMPMP